MNQMESVKRYMQINDSITSADAIHKLHISRLASVIGKLEKQGEIVNRVSEVVDGEYGKCTITRYSLCKIQDNQLVMI